MTPPLDALLREYVTPGMRAAKWKKTGRTYTWRADNGDRAIITFEVSAGARSDVSEFGIVVAVATFTDPGAAAYANAVAFSSDGRTLATADNNGGAYLWSIATGNRIATLTQPISLDNVNGDDAAESVAFSPDGVTVAVGYYFGHIDIWNAATGRRVAALPRASSMADTPITLSPDGKIFTAFSNLVSVTSAAFSPDSKTLATSDNFGGTYLWNIAAGSRIAAFPAPHGAYVQSVAFSPDGTILATADLDGHVYLWNIVTGRRIAALSDPSGNPPDAIAFSPDGSTIAVGDDNKNAPDTPAGVSCSRSTSDAAGMAGSRESAGSAEQVHVAAPIALNHWALIVSTHVRKSGVLSRV